MAPCLLRIGACPTSIGVLHLNYTPVCQHITRESFTGIEEDLSWLTLYGYMISRAGQSRFGTRVREALQGVTGVVLIALGVRLAFEQK